MMEKLNIEKMQKVISDKCCSCGAPLIKGLNYSGWMIFNIIDGVEVQCPVCNKCANKNDGGQKRE